ncbi:MAG: serine/threonine-protein kinase, partial [Rubripirellula sp.]
MNTAKQSTRCPDTDSLREILQGDISSGDSEAILQHLLECDRCIKQADEISLSDPLIQTIRSRPGLEAFGWESDSELRKSVIERGMQLGDDTLTALDPTLAVDPAGTDGDSVSTDQATEIRRRLNLDFLAPADHPAELGRLGDFRIVEVLGRGGMGVVFKANDTTLDRIVALKIMVPDLNVTDALKQRFLREAKSMAAVEHGNVVEVYRVGEESGVPYVAMKYLRGQTLRSLVNQKGRLTEREIARIGRETADGLAAVHACGLIHRDLKPDNLWIEKSGTVKILDFGLAAADDDMNLTQSGMLVGTPAYMSPEQALSLELDARSDLFSFGSTLYLAACGKPAFDGKRPTALLMAVAKGEFEPVAQVCPDMDTELASVLSRLMALERDERYENANEVAVAFERIHDRLSHSESVLSPVASSDVGSGNRNRRYAIVALAAAVPLLLALFAVVMKFQMKGGTIELTIDDHAQPINVNLQNKDEIEIIDPIDGKPILIGVDRKAQQLVIRKAGF